MRRIPPDRSSSPAGPIERARNSNRSFAKFVEDGGVFLTFGVASNFPTEFGITRTVDAQNTSSGWYAPGSYVQTETLQPSYPVLHGYQDRAARPRFARQDSRLRREQELGRSLRILPD